MKKNLLDVDQQNGDWNLLIAKGKPFVRALLHWHHHQNDRQMPWKEEKDPYKIWLSEVILQQTRVEQGTKYYEKFIKAYPNITALAHAPEDEVFKLWEGLGYYSRCRNLLATARTIAFENQGIFPRDYPTIRSLKGVGDYTAAAISSFAFNLPYAVLDGNVLRVLSRIFALDIPVDSTKGKKFFAGLAQNLLPLSEPAAFNQAMMDFGATICKPLPLCSQCFYQSACRAFELGQQQALPVKEKSVRVTTRYINYIVAVQEEHIAVRQRNDNDIWGRLYEFIPLENPVAMSAEAALQQAEIIYQLKDYELINIFQVSQKLTHQRIHFQFLNIQLMNRQEIPGFSWLPFTQLRQLAFPRTLQQYLAHLLSKK